MGELYEKIFWLNLFRNGGSTSAGTVAQSKTERWLNLAGLGAQKHPEYSETATEVIYHRADAEKEFMGLMNFAGE